MKRWGAVLCVVYLLTGCSAASVLTGLVGSKPDISAQVGAENTKQTLGLNNKVDASTSTDVSDSTVGTLDTSSKKQVQSISTGTIKAEKLQVVNNDGTSIILAAVAGASVPLIVIIVLYVLKRLFDRVRGRKSTVEEE